VTEQQEAAAALAAAEKSRAAIVRDLRFPRGYHATTVFFYTWFIVLMAVPWGDAAVPLKISLPLLFAGMLGTLWNTRRLRLLNGMSVNVLSLRTRSSARIRLAFSAGYLASVAVALYAAHAHHWWLVAVAALAGGSSHALLASTLLRASKAEHKPHAD